MIAMKKKIVIERCFDCPYCDDLWMCNHPDMNLRDLAEPHKIIQGWCPLEREEERR